MPESNRIYVTGDTPIPENADVQTGPRGGKYYEPTPRAQRSGEVGAVLKRKIGPLPTYGWAIIAGGMLVGFFYLRRKNGALQYADDSGAATDPGYAAGGYGVGSGAASGGGASPFFPTPPVNADSPTLPPAAQTPVTTPPPTPPPTAIQPAYTPPSNVPAYTPPPSNAPTSLRDMPGYNPILETPSDPTLDYTPAPDYYTVTDVNGRVWNIPKGQPIPSYLDMGRSSAPTATVPAAPAAPINIPQTSLSPGAWNEITSPGGTITGLQGWSAWDYLGGGQWQQWNEGEYSAPGSTLGLLPVGMSLPGGRTARAA